LAEKTVAKMAAEMALTSVGSSETYLVGTMADYWEKTLVGKLEMMKVE
jgi:hypothetical protein